MHQKFDKHQMRAESVCCAASTSGNRQSVNENDVTKKGTGRADALHLST